MHKLPSRSVPALVVAILCFLLGAVFLGVWAADIFFYWQNGWNLDASHSGFELKSGKSDGVPMSNLSRLIYGWPIMIAVCCFIGAAAVRGRK